MLYLTRKWIFKLVQPLASHNAPVYQMLTQLAVHGCINDNLADLFCGFLRAKYRQRCSQIGVN